MRITERAERTFPGGIPRRVCSAVRKRAYEIARERTRREYEALCASMLDLIEAGALHREDVAAWRPAE